MRAKKVSRIVGFVFVVAAIGGIGATAWGSETEPAPGNGGTVPVVTTPGGGSGTEVPAPAPKKNANPVARLFDIVWT